MKRLLAGLGIALGLGLVLYALFGARSDEERIRERLDQLARAVSVGEDENIVFRRSRLDRELEQVLTDDVLVDIPELSANPRGREAVVRLTLAATYHEAPVDVAIEPRHIEVRGGQAEVKASVDVTGGQDFGRDRRDVAFELVKDPTRDWQISAARVEPALE